MSSHTRKPVHAYLKIYDGGSKVITNFSATNSLTQDARETSQLDPANTLAVNANYSCRRESLGVSNLVGVPRLFNIQDPVMRALIKVIARITASSNLTCACGM